MFTWYCVPLTCQTTPTTPRSANYVEHAVLRAQLNSILAMLPSLKLDNDGDLSTGAKNLGGGYALLRACEDTAKPVTEVEALAIMDYWQGKGWPRAVKRWARLRLPNGQIARTSWNELQSRRPLRRTRCVKVMYIIFRL